MSVSDAVIRHYTHAAIAARILAALREANGPDASVTPETLAPLDQFHSRGVAATAELVRLLDPQPGEHVLDIGCGIGGPARWIAAKAGCHVTGVDLTPAFCEAAVALTEAAGLADRVRILEGSALTLPLPDASFDRAYSQNVVMNIADKHGVYREAFRVLRPGGVLALANLAAGAAGPPTYPVPWAATAATSFLAPPEATREDLEAAGFEILAFADITQAVIAAQEALRRQIREQGPPRLGVQVVVGPEMLERQRNSARGLAEGRLVALEILVRRPGA